MRRLDGKIALITGGGGAIGDAIARRFVAEGALALRVDRDAVKLASRTAPAEGADWPAWVADVGREAEVIDLFGQVGACYGRLDILVNNAAAWGGDGPVGQIDEAIWDAIQDATVKSVFLCSKHALPLLPRPGGAIVNIASVNALFGLALAAYTAAKGGVLALTRVLAMMHGPEGIRVNAISPGTIRTESWEPVLAKNPAALDEWSARYPLRRVGAPDEVAALAAFLASDESANTTGANFVMDGGLSAGLALPEYGPSARTSEEV